MTVVEARPLPLAEQKFEAFLHDIEPFFAGQPFFYIDVGAYRGATFRSVFRSPLRPKRAYLLEPNPASFAGLCETVKSLGASAVAACYPAGVGAAPGQARFRADDTMTRVLDLIPEASPEAEAAAGPDAAPPAEAPPGTGGAASGDREFLAEIRTLDGLAGDFVSPRISLLKIDVEGFELEVLAGAETLLRTQAVEIIYIEAGFDPEGRRQTYYRAIEDRLRGFGYGLFRVYEQKNEWISDSPLLRRVNLAFMSRAFADGHPMRLSRELYALRQKQAALEAQSEERGKALETATAAEARRAEHEKALEAALAEARTAAAAGAAEAAELRTALKALSDRTPALEAAAAEQARLLAEHQAAARAEAERTTALTRELQDLRRYGRSLETRHQQVLESSSWRMLEPARRTVQLLKGKKPPPAFTPLLTGGSLTPHTPAARKKGGDIGSTAGNSRKTGEAILQLTSKRDFVALVAKERSIAGEPPSDKTFFLGRLCRLLALSSLSAYSEVARAADEITARLGEKHPWIIKVFGEPVYTRFVSETAMALTRVGRFEEARRLINAAIDHLNRAPELLQLRAEVCWPYAPEEALEDIAECRRRGSQNSIQILLQAYLETMILERPVPLDGLLAEHRQMPLVAAAVGLKQGDFKAYKTHLNRYFETQGLLAPLPQDATHFAFGDLVRQKTSRRDGPLVSVVMTTYNSEATVDYAVASLLQQTHGHLEIFIVDDCSTDGTRARLQALQAADPRIQVLLNEDNIGTYCSKNRALERAAGAYATMHDSDDWAHPERIARHVEMMERTPSLIASRSEWLRLDTDGALNFRRWGRKFQHPNPASAFFRRETLDRVGFFDSVRFGADSEHWYRMQRVFGRSRVKSLPLCLGLGSIRADSLTRSGSGAMAHENYSPIRGAYAASYFYWHATAPADSLKLPPRIRVRPFPAPPEMAVAAPGAQPGDQPGAGPDAAAAEFMFGISLASRQVTADWARTEELLGHTLRSVLNQSDPRFSVVICGHERPHLAELDDPRVLFIPADHAPPAKASTGGFRGDKMRKRRLIGALLRQRGGGYFFPLDADDLVHRDVVAHVLKDDNRRGYLIEAGYALDYMNGTLAPVPGAWSMSFDRSCGSSAVIFFAAEELPLNGNMDEDLYFNLFQSHAYWPIVAEESGRRLEPLPFRGGVYVVNHSENLSFRLQRKGVRTANIIRSIADHRVEEADRILAGEFGQPDRTAAGTLVRVGGRPPQTA